MRAMRAVCDHAPTRALHPRPWPNLAVRSQIKRLINPRTQQRRLSSADCKCLQTTIFSSRKNNKAVASLQRVDQKNTMARSGSILRLLLVAFGMSNVRIIHADSSMELRRSLADKYRPKLSANRRLQTCEDIINEYISDLGSNAVCECDDTSAPNSFGLTCTFPDCEGDDNCIVDPMIGDVCAEIGELSATFERDPVTGGYTQTAFNMCVSYVAGLTDSAC